MEGFLSWTILEGELDHEDVRSLLAQHFAEMRAGSPPAACHVLPVDGLKVPEIRFFTMREGGVLVGCGALKRLGGGHGEIKSMRTADAALGRGVGKAILDHLVDMAIEEGFDAGQGDALRQLVLQYQDVFRLRVGNDEPAKVEPLQIRFQPDECHTGAA